MRVTVHASLDQDSNLKAKVTGHGPYAGADEHPDFNAKTGKVPDGAAVPGEVSVDVALSELGDEGAAVAKELAAVLDKARKLAATRLERRFNDARYQTRQVAQVRQEIVR